MKRTKNPFDPAKPVKVYWNLHKHLFSVQQRGLVVGHTEAIHLVDATFKVSAAGRRRVLREKRKNVHAFIVGTISEHPWGLVWDRHPRSTVPVTYNPYRYSTFVLKHDEEPIHESAFVRLSIKDGKGVIEAE